MDIHKIIYNTARDIKIELRDRINAMLASAKQFPPSEFGAGQISTLGAFLILLDDIIQLDLDEEDQPK